MFLTFGKKLDLRVWNVFSLNRFEFVCMSIIIIRKKGNLMFRAAVEGVYDKTDSYMIRRERKTCQLQLLYKFPCSTHIVLLNINNKPYPHIFSYHLTWALVWYNFCYTLVLRNVVPITRTCVDFFIIHLIFWKKSRFSLIQH